MRKVAYGCAERGVKVLTLFAFSSENWRRPQREIGNLMGLFESSLQGELEELDRHGVRLRFIGGRERYSPSLRAAITAGEERTAGNADLLLQIAADYGGRWDIVQAARRIALAVGQGEMGMDEIDEARFDGYLTTAQTPPPDLLIRTGGERRISNFLLWQLAYTELYFTDTLWPDFSGEDLDLAIADYRNRQRRFGKTGAQAVRQAAKTARSHRETIPATRAYRHG